MPRQNRFVPTALEFGELEHRQLMNGDLGSVHANLFHKNGVDGLKLSPPFINRLDSRFAISLEMNQRLFQAFQVFGQNALGQTVLISGAVQPLFPQAADGTSGPLSNKLPKGVTVGTTPSSLALPGLVSTLTQQVSSALSTNVVTNIRPQPSQVTAPTFSHLMAEVLVPYGQSQIEQMAAQLTPNPAGGAVVTPQALSAYQHAYSNILNAVAEFTVHPNLFRSPSSFYSNPNVQFTTAFDGIPATAGYGYFIRGQGGVILRGAVLHPHRHN